MSTLRDAVGQTWDCRYVAAITFLLENHGIARCAGIDVGKKSTLLSLIAGLALPNQGRVEVNGRVAALLELGSGFHPDLSGAENLMLNAALLGLNRGRALQLFDKIVDFSGDWRVYRRSPAYLLERCEQAAYVFDRHSHRSRHSVDRRVGDSAFRPNALMLEYIRRSGTTLIFVSHSAASVQRMCDQALWIDQGEVMMHGAAPVVLAGYEGRSALETKV